MRSKVKANPTTSAAPAIESKRQRKRREMAEAGERYLVFCIKVELWERFVKLCCAGERPNRVFIRMVEKAVEEREGNSTAKV